VPRPVLTVQGADGRQSGRQSAVGDSLHLVGNPEIEFEDVEASAGLEPAVEVLQTSAASYSER